MLNCRLLFDATLSPRRLLALLQARLKLDDPVVGDWLLADAYRLSAAEPMCIELRRAAGGGCVRVEFEPDDTGSSKPEPYLRVAGLRVGYRSRVATPEALSGSRALADALEAVIGPEPRAWVAAPPGLSELVDEVEAEVSWRPSTLAVDPDADLLERDRDHYERLYEARPDVRQVSACDRDAPGVSIHYPASRGARVPNSAAVYPSSLRVAHRRRMRRYFGGLGCVFDAQAVIRTVPTPATYHKAVPAGFARVRPTMVRGLTASVPPVVWGALVGRNVLPVSVAPRWAVELHRRIRGVGLLAQIPCDVGMLVHDIGLHALALHAVPAEAWDELVAMAVDRVRARPASVLRGRRGVLGRLGTFFEGSVTTHCWHTWHAVDEPEDFATEFASHFQMLREELSQL